MCRQTELQGERAQVTIGIQLHAQPRSATPNEHVRRMRYQGLEVLRLHRFCDISLLVLFMVL